MSLVLLEAIFKLNGSSQPCLVSLETLNNPELASIAISTHSNVFFSKIYSVKYRGNFLIRKINYILFNSCVSKVTPIKNLNSTKQKSFYQSRQV